MATRARIVLACAEGKRNRDVAATLGLSEATVGKWRRRFVADRLDGLHDEPRSGAPRTIDDARIEAVIVKTLESVPQPATHWSSRGMATASGLSVLSVQRIWRAFGLQPHRLETFSFPPILIFENTMDVVLIVLLVLAVYRQEKGAAETPLDSEPSKLLAILLFGVVLGLIVPIFTMIFMRQSTP